MSIVELVAQDMRSIGMSKMVGWTFQCSTTTCLPFNTIIVSNIRRCQMVCLAQSICQAASFNQLNSNCQLFTDIPNQNGNMLADINTDTMIAMTGTRIPPGQYRHTARNHIKNIGEVKIDVREKKIFFLFNLN
jgi:hypothetical protein